MEYVLLKDVIDTLNAYDYRGVDVDTIVVITDEIVEKIKKLEVVELKQV